MAFEYDCLKFGNFLSREELESQFPSEFIPYNLSNYYDSVGIPQTRRPSIRECYIRYVGFLGESDFIEVEVYDLRKNPLMSKRAPTDPDNEFSLSDDSDSVSLPARTPVVYECQITVCELVKNKVRKVGVSPSCLKIIFPLQQVQKSYRKGGHLIRYDKTTIDLN